MNIHGDANAHRMQGCQLVNLIKIGAIRYGRHTCPSCNGKFYVTTSINQKKRLVGRLFCPFDGIPFQISGVQKRHAFASDTDGNI